MSEPRRAALARALRVVLRVGPWLALAALAVVLVRTAWISDDAYISFRVIRNFVDGDGMRWNLAERVQVFTHPLWFFALAALRLVTGELYYTTVALSIAISLAVAAVMAFRVAPTRAAGIAAAVALLSARSFVDFSTSGLENPLTHLLLALFVWRLVATATWTPRALFRLALIACLLATNRLDAILLVGPALAWAWWQNGTRRGLAAAVAGFAPLALWELVSLIYFGFLFPNTAYAKITGAITLGSRVGKGLGYLLSTAIYDRVTVLVIAAALVLAIARRAPALRALAIGVALYLAYILWVGGDFMAGRFLTGPLILAVGIVARAWSSSSGAPGGSGVPAARASRTARDTSSSDLRWLAAAALALALALSLGSQSPLLAGSDFGQEGKVWISHLDKRKIADERAFYYWSTGLLRAKNRWSPPKHGWFDEGRAMPPATAIIAGNVGFSGWAAPRDTFIIDRLGLGDAFLARLPPRDVKVWRPGHLERAMPDGYLDSRRTGQVLLRNHWMAAYYRDILVVTQGPIFSGERWSAIWRLNTGGDAGLLAHHADVEVDATALAAPVADGTSWRAPGNIVLAPGATLYVRLPAARTAARVRLAADGNDRYDLTFLRGGQPAWTGAIPPAVGGSGIVNRSLELPASAGAFDTVIVRGSGGDQRYSVGSLLLE